MAAFPFSLLKVAECKVCGCEIIAKDGAEELGQSLIGTGLRGHMRESRFGPESNVESEGY